jgi:hypothetical protein
MTSAGGDRRGPGPLAWLLLAAVLLVAGAAAAIWGLSHNPSFARLVGVAPSPVAAGPVTVATLPVGPPAAPAGDPDDGAAAARIGELEARLSRVENATQRAEGSAGRADALLVAFAARRAIDRGVPLGYLENLLAERFGATHPQAVATVITASRTPVRLDQLSAEFAAIEPQVSAGGPGESGWTAFKRQLSGLIAIRHSDQPSTRPGATFARVQARLGAGAISEALAEAMRLPGIDRAPHWVGQARTYVTAHRALDEIESSALLAGAPAPATTPRPPPR